MIIVSIRLPFAPAVKQRDSPVVPVIAVLAVTAEALTTERPVDTGVSGKIGVVLAAMIKSLREIDYCTNLLRLNLMRRLLL